MRRMIIFVAVALILLLSFLTTAAPDLRNQITRHYAVNSIIEGKEVLEETHKSSRAVPYAMKAIEHDPYFAEAYLFAAQMMFMEEDHEDVLPYYEKVMELKPKLLLLNAEILHVCTMYAYVGRYGGARACVKFTEQLLEEDKFVFQKGFERPEENPEEELVDNMKSLINKAENKSKE